jgi:hypothetical protein
MLDGDFVAVGKQAHHIVIVATFLTIISSGTPFTDTLRYLFRTIFRLSALEHSAYVSDGSDNYVIGERFLWQPGERSSVQHRLRQFVSRVVEKPGASGYRRKSPREPGPWVWLSWRRKVRRE